MREKIFMLLDELVSMSNSDFTTESLEMELADLNKKINKINLNIKKFKGTLNDSKYFDISSQMMDKNVEINLKKRISDTENELEEIEIHLQESLNKEKENYNKLNKLENNINELERLIKVLKQKQNVLKNNESKNIYRELVEETTEKLHHIEDEKDSKLVEKTEIEQELKLLTTTKKDLSIKLQDETVKLKDIQNVLANDKNYYNYESKKADEEYLQHLLEQLTTYEHNKLQFLTDPANLAIEAKKLIVEGKITDAISKIKELVTVVEGIPDIKEKNIDILKSKQEDLRAQIENKKNEIGEKKYKTKENTCLESRSEYLSDLISDLKVKSKSLKEMIDAIDNKSIIDLKLEINVSEENKLYIENNISELEQLKQTSNSINLIASIKSYQKELDSINKTIEKQTDDLEYLVNLSCMLENNVSNLEKKIVEKTSEINSIERELSLKTKLIDEKSKISDEKDLEKLQLDLKYIDNRLKYKKTPDDIYNEIDCLLGSLDFDEPIRRTRLSRTAKYKEEKQIDSIKESVETLEIKQEPKRKRLKIVDIEEPTEEIPEMKYKPQDEIPSIDEDNIGFNDILNLIGESQ